MICNNSNTVLQSKEKRAVTSNVLARSSTYVPSLYSATVQMSKVLIHCSRLPIPVPNWIKQKSRLCPNADNLARDTHVVDCTLYSALSDALKNTGGEKSIKCSSEDALAGSGNTREPSTVELMLYPFVKGVMVIITGKGDSYCLINNIERTKQ